MADISIHGLKELKAFACALANSLEQSRYPVILLEGQLGAGKTTFVRELVQLLPGGNQCEVASPSFNICNIYPSDPEIMHYDLYRCKSFIPEELCEAFEDHAHLVIVEWANFLDSNDLPDNYLDICFKLEQNTRLLEILAVGSLAEDALLKMIKILEQSECFSGQQL